jgi:hypothetical protein
VELAAGAIACAVVVHRSIMHHDWGYKQSAETSVSPALRQDFGGVGCCLFFTGNIREFIDQGDDC